MLDSHARDRNRARAPARASSAKRNVPGAMRAPRKPPPRSGLVIVDKPAGSRHTTSSRGCADRGTRKVGHAGTLDPMATGVLVIGVERATKLLGHLAATSKEYTATIRLGQSTHTDDAEGEITTQSDADGVDTSRPSSPPWRR